MSLHKTERYIQLKNLTNQMVDYVKRRMTGGNCYIPDVVQEIQKD